MDYNLNDKSHKVYSMLDFYDKHKILMHCIGLNNELTKGDAKVCLSAPYNKPEAFFLIPSHLPRYSRAVLSHSGLIAT